MSEGTGAQAEPKSGRACEYACMLRLGPEASLAEALARMGDPANCYADMIHHAMRRAGVPVTVCPEIGLRWQQRPQVELTGWCFTARCTMP